MRRREKSEYEGKTPLPDSKQELFCELFTTNTLPIFWSHGQNSYSFAYNHYKRIEELQSLEIGPASARKGKFKTVVACRAEIKRIENVCKSCATKLLTRADIKARCGFLLDTLASHIIVDRELLWTIQQRKHPDAKVAAIKHHDQRTQRIRDRIEIKHEFEPIKVITIKEPNRK